MVSMNIVSYDKTFPKNGFREKPSNYLFIINQDEFRELLTAPQTKSVCYLHNVLTDIAQHHSDNFAICVHNRIFEGINYPYIGIMYSSSDNYGFGRVVCNDEVAQAMLILSSFDYVRLDRIGAYN